MSSIGGGQDFMLFLGRSSKNILVAKIQRNQPNID